YIDVLNTVLTNWDMVLLIENINILIDVAKELNNDNSIDIDVLNEFVDISLNNSFMKIALFDTNEIKRNIYFLCYEKFEEKIGYYYYKCEKTLKTMLENILLGKNLKDINKMADKIYSMYVKQYEEVSNNGKHNPKEE
ncbi:MAG: hypothetical protein ACI4RG_08890, partial [Huintestinicola sp.]